jgi:hypothetical protein
MQDSNGLIESCIYSVCANWSLEWLLQHARQQWFDGVVYLLCLYQLEP